jgi:uncharacterized membrane protein YgcG
MKLFLLFPVIFFISAPLFGLSRVVDNADLLSDAETARLESLLDTTSLAYDFDLVVLTENDTDEIEPEDFAADRKSVV